MCAKVHNQKTGTERWYVAQHLHLFCGRKVTVRFHRGWRTFHAACTVSIIHSFALPKWTVSVPTKASRRRDWYHHCCDGNPLWSIAQNLVHCAHSAGAHAVHTCNDEPEICTHELVTVINVGAHCAHTSLSALYTVARCVDYRIDSDKLWIQLCGIVSALLSRWSRYVNTCILSVAGVQQGHQCLGSVCHA